MSSQDLEEAIALYDKGKFKASRELFENLYSQTNSHANRDFFAFNISSCYASEGNYREAIRHMDALSDDFLRGHKDCLIYNRALCLFKELREEYESKDEKYLYDRRTESLNQLLNLLNQNQPSSMQYESIRELVKAVVDSIASVLWRNGQYRTLEKLLINIKQALTVEEDPEYFDIWRKNTAHSLFMTDIRFEDAARMYETLLPKVDGESLLTADPIVLANLCASNVLTGHNGDAERLIKEVEQEECEFSNFDYDDSGQQTTDKHSFAIVKQLSHSDHINLTIGTLYCVKSNFEFGLSRLFKSVQPIKDKLNPVSWFHIKRCILAMLNQYCKQTLTVHDDLFDQIVTFLIQCEMSGSHVQSAHTYEAATCIEAPSSNDKSSVSQEARYLRALILSVIHD